MARTIKDYRTSLKYANERVESKEQEKTKWQLYAWDLEAKLDVTLDRLQTIAEGRYYTGECEATSSDRNRITAAVGLRKVARMRERKP